MSDSATVRAVAASRPTESPNVKRRLVSVDVLRGLTVAFMILVNTAGDGSVSYAQLRHSVWNGCTLTDLVFPTFLFIMGVSMIISLRRGGAAQLSAAARVAKATRRSAILILIGLVLNAFPHFSMASLRYCGVMQRIGITYWLGALLLLWLDWLGIAVVCAVLLFGYWALMTLVPVPGYGKMGLELGVLNPMANLASALDRIAIPTAHIYRHTFYDPEGLLSTLPALASVLMGMLAGRLLQARQMAGRLVWMAGCGAAFLLTGLAWNAVFPINKRLWTSSYVLWAAGFDFLLLAIFSFYLDHPGPAVAGARRRFLVPWLAFGSNALAAYVLSELLAPAISAIRLAPDMTLQHWSYLLIPAWAGTSSLRSLEWSIVFTAICYVPIHLLYRKGILIKL